MRIKIVVSGNMTMDAGSAILAENTVGSGSGGNIAITVGGDFVIHGGAPGAKISSSDTTGGGSTGKAGNITITVGDFSALPPTGSFTMDAPASIVADSSVSPAAPSRLRWRNRPTSMVSSSRLA